MGFLLLTNGVGGLGAAVTVGSISNWYSQLVKPAGNPPSWVFGPVWTTLYVLIAISAWVVFVRRGNEGRARAMGLFWIQLVLNGVWTPVFFGLHALGLALGVILLLDLSVVTWIAVSARVSRTASLLLIPYLLWILYATYLNYGIWSLNRG